MTKARQQKPCGLGLRRSLIALPLIFLAAGEGAAGSYPREVIEQFITAWQGNQPLDAEREAYCRCAIGVLQSRVPYQRFVDWDRRTRTGEVIPERDEALAEIRTECEP